ncbi:MAG: dienelactone hydrolase [Actinobacteria bacterium]|nr:dienelactone hydrolase [Actinomycetota bacterium]
METALTGWTRSTFEAAGLEREVWTKGSGPAVIVVHEVPGITPKVLAFAEEVVASGFTVAMPSLVGTPGREMSNKYAVRSLLKVCVAREFVSLATNRTSPVIAWLRALARDVHGRAGGKGVGAVGMCFSGGFALGMMVDDIMVAPVLSQPSLPFPVGRKRAADLNLSPDDAAVIAERAAGGCEVLGLRFTKDKLVGDRFSSLRTLLGDAFIAVEIPSEKPNDHSVLTEQRHDESVQRVLQFFRDKLL